MWSKIYLCITNGFWDVSTNLFIFNPASIYLLKVNNRGSRTSCEICSELTIKTLEWDHWHLSGVFIVNFEYTSHLALVFQLLTLTRLMMHVKSNPKDLKPISVQCCILSKNYTKTATWKLVPGHFAMIKHSLYWKMRFLKQPAYIRYVTAKLSKFVKIKMHTSLDSFLQGILWKLKSA